MPETKTDISGQTWDDLYDLDYGDLRELAKQRNDVRGDGSREEICAGLLVSEDRADVVPEHYQYLLDDQSELDDDEVDDSDEDGEPDEDDEPDEPDTEFQKASDFVPNMDESFIIEAGPLQEWVGHIDTQVDECKLHLTDDGMNVRAVDPANVGMVDTELYETAFESFDVPKEGLIGINITRFNDIIDGADADQLVNITYDATTRKLIVEYGGHKFTLALIDPDAIRTEPDLPDLDLPVKLEADNEAMQAAMAFSADISDHVAVTTSPEGTFKLEAEGDTDEYAGTFEDGEEVTVEELPNAEREGLYSLDYIKYMVNAFEVDEITLIHGHEFPIKIEGPVVYDDEEYGFTTYMLAPRIQG
jgi:proliferating cell nuclear antigen